MPVILERFAAHLAAIRVRESGANLRERGRTPLPSVEVATEAEGIPEVAGLHHRRPAAEAAHPAGAGLQVHEAAAVAECLS